MRTSPCFVRLKQFACALVWGSFQFAFLRRRLDVPRASFPYALSQVGDIITVTKTNINGQWEGELKGRVGHFPFTHVEFIDSENPDDDES